MWRKVESLPHMMQVDLMSDVGQRDRNMRPISNNDLMDVNVLMRILSLKVSALDSVDISDFLSESLAGHNFQKDLINITDKD